MSAVLTCRREDFSLPPGLHYLNCAYMSPIPRLVQEAGVRGVLRKADPSAILARDFFAEVERVRSLFARLIGATDPGRVAIIPAASYGLATAAQNAAVSRGQNVVISGEQFPSNVYTWRELCRRRGLELRTVDPPVTNLSRGSEWNARLLESIDSGTAVVALPHVHWTDGTRFDLDTIGRRARDLGATFVIDGTQSIGALPFNVEELRPDALICAAYKWLLGPYSLGLAWYGPRFDGGRPLEDNWITRQGSDDFRGLVNYVNEYEAGARRFDVGERSNFALMPMLVAGLECVLDWSAESIQRYCLELTRAPLERARQLGYRVEEESWRAAHLFGMRMPDGIDLDVLNRELQTARVFASLRGSALRVSPHVYNDAEDLDALLLVLERVLTSGASVGARL